MEWMHPSTFLHKVKTLNINVNYILKIRDKRWINFSYDYSTQSFLCRIYHSLLQSTKLILVLGDFVFSHYCPVGCFHLQAEVLTWLSQGSSPNELFMQNLLGIQEF